MGIVFLLYLRNQLIPHMTTLFPAEPVFPDGFFYLPDFLSADEEEMLIQAINTLELHTLIFQGFEAKRKVASFGYDYNFDKRSISKGEDIPAGFHSLIRKVADYLSLQPDEFAEILVTEYPPGSVINWHRDAPPFDMIVGISLLSGCSFRVRPYDKAKRGRRSILSLPVQARSLYILKDEVRSDWEHSISPVSEKRYSITLRTLRK